MVKVQVYQKATHTKHYLNFSCHHLLNHKLGVIHTLYTVVTNIVTEEVDATKEIEHVNCALGACGYPSLSFKRVREQMDQWEWKNNQKITKKDSQDNCTKIKAIAIHQRCVRGAEPGLPPSWSGNVDETAPDTQEDAGTCTCTCQGQMHMTGELWSGVLSPCKDCQCIYTGEMERRYGVREKKHKRCYVLQN